MDNERTREAVADWATAELSGDPAAIGDRLTEDFVAVGPLGFLLSRHDWLHRHATGALRYAAFTITDLQIRTYGDSTAVVIGRQVVDGTYERNPVPAQSRATLLMIDSRLAGIHMSLIAGTPGAPPIPGPPQ